MFIGIDASNLRSGGGITHIHELIKTADPNIHGFSKIILWSGTDTLYNIEDRDWLIKVNEPLLNKSLFYRILWQFCKLKKLAEIEGCDVLFVPGGSIISGFKPVVTMSRNLLPFEWHEMKRFGFSIYTIKFLLLRLMQSLSFRKANGVIFLTEYAKNTVLKVTGNIKGQSTIIPHGVKSSFLKTPKKFKIKREYTNIAPLRILYVSIIDVYKHQWQVALAVADLKSQGIPVILELVGPPGRGIRKLNNILKKLDRENLYIIYRGEVNYYDLPKYYEEADILVFASSCENMPNILIEGMASGLPIACSSMGPMPEVLGNSGIYFNPENPQDIAKALTELINSPDLRYKLAQSAYLRVQKYSWVKCADETFKFINKIAKEII